MHPLHPCEAANELECHYGQPFLPSEVILHIISFLDNASTRKIFIGVNRFITQEVERLSVYRRVHLTRAPSRQRFFAAIRSNVQRASYVQTLVLSFENGGSTASHEDLLTLNFFVNIRSLTIRQTSNFASAVVIDGLTRCHFPHLTHFRSAWSLHNPLFRNFLSRHPSLRSIGLSKSFSMAFGMPTSFPPALLPHLEDLEGHWSNVVRLVEGRPVSRITISSANMASYVPLHKLAAVLPIASRSTSQTGVRNLTVHVLRADAPIVDLIACSIPSLNSLSLLDASYSEIQNAEEQAVLAQLVADALTKFTSLREFIVDWIPFGDVEPHVEVFGEVVKTLRRLSIGGKVWVRADRRGRWRLEASTNT